MKQIRIYCTTNDMANILRQIEGCLEVKYVKMGNFSSQSEISVMSNLSISGCLDSIHARSTMLSESYLILPIADNLNVRIITDIHGKRRFLVDQLLNNESATITPGGVRGGEEVIIEGRIASAYKSEFWKSIEKKFKDTFKNSGSVVNGVFLGKEAAQLAQEGWRLTPDISSPASMNFRIG